MIFSAIAGEWKHIGDDNRAGGVFRDFLGSENRRTSELISKISLNETNDPIYHDVVLLGKEISSAERKSWTLSNKLLETAFSRIKNKLHIWARELGDPSERLLDLEEFLASSTNIILIEVGDEADAFVLFETLNDRGLELAVSDLVKNYLFSLAGGHIERFKKLWVEIIVLVGSENLTSFLRHFWNSEHETTRERELYRVLKGTVKNPTSAREFIERLRKVADLYAALLNPEHAYWSDFPSEVRTHLDALLTFKVTQFRPVALAAMETYKPNDVTKAFEILSVFSFRYTIVSALATGHLERIYSASALAIRDGRAKTPAKLFGFLKPSYVPDDRFEEDFSTKVFSKAPIARYILSALNDYLENDVEKMVAEKGGRVTLEHILPKNPNQKWKGAIASDENIEDYVDQIGNLTLLEKGKNKGISTLGFKEKKEAAFVDSSLAINKEILKFTSWTTKEIEERSNNLAKIAKKIWRIEY
jgi:hypothetical protein